MTAITTLVLICDHCGVTRTWVSHSMEISATRPWMKLGEPLLRQWPSLWAAMGETPEVTFCSVSHAQAWVDARIAPDGPKLFINDWPDAP